MNTAETTVPLFNPEAVSHARRIVNWTFGTLTVAFAVGGAEPQAIITGLSWFLIDRALTQKSKPWKPTKKPRNPIRKAEWLAGISGFLLAVIVIKLHPLVGFLAAWGAAVGMRKLLSSPTFRGADDGLMPVVQPPVPPTVAPVAPPAPPAAVAVDAPSVKVEPALIVAARADIERLRNAATKLGEAEVISQVNAVAESLNATLTAIAEDEEKTASARTLLSVHLPAAADLTEDFAAAPKSARTTTLRNRFKQLIGSLSERSDALHERFVGREARKLDVKMEVLKKRLEEDY
jgi:formaldehyde-activating enzyme involved in methanogenesis